MEMEMTEDEGEADEGNAERRPRWPGRPPKAPAPIQLLVKATLKRLLAEPTIATKPEGEKSWSGGMFAGKESLLHVSI